MDDGIGESVLPVPWPYAGAYGTLISQRPELDWHALVDSRHYLLVARDLDSSRGRRKAGKLGLDETIDP